MNKTAKPKCCVLVIDDDPVFLQTARHFLADDYRVDLVKSGKQAIEYLDRGNTPDLILLDITMSEMDGYETLRRIKAKDGMAEIPVMFVTSLTGAESELRGLELGAVDYITKPFVKEILLKRIEIHLKQAKKLAASRKAGAKKAGPVTALTPWELRIARLARQGLPSTEIASRMETTDNTIRVALSGIYTKLGIHSKYQLPELDLNQAEG